MNRVLLISPNNETNPLIFPIGLGYIRSSLLKNDFEVGILDFAHLPFQKNVLLSYLNQYKPNFVCISIRNLDNCCCLRPRSFINPIKEIASWIKERDSAIPIIIGGSGFSLLPQIWLQTVEADFGIVGDGTKSLPILLNCLRNREDLNNLPGFINFNKYKWIGYPTEHAERLDEIPFPSRDGFVHPLQENQKVRYNIQTKRGCNFKCIYCAYPLLEGKNLRLRSPKNVVDEIQEMLEKYYINEFDFVDNVFNNPLEQASAICREIISRKLKVTWSCFLNPAFCSKDFLNLLIDAGCTHVEFGIDSASNKMLKTMKKNFNQNDIRSIVDYCKDTNISYNLCLLFGCPGETVETVRETLRFLNELGVEQIFGLIGVRILPNTEIHHRYSMNLKISDLLEPKFYISKKIHPDQILNEFDTFYKEKNPGWMIL
jgi:radical SAM superfamily enzyme YgiQ (UPF0313 family)